MHSVCVLVIHPPNWYVIYCSLCKQHTKYPFLLNSGPGNERTWHHTYFLVCAVVESHIDDFKH